MKRFREYIKGMLSLGNSDVIQGNWIERHLRLNILVLRNEIESLKAKVADYEDRVKVLETKLKEKEDESVRKGRQQQRKENR